MFCCSYLHNVRYPKALDTNMGPCIFSSRSNSASMHCRTFGSRTVTAMEWKLAQVRALSKDNFKYKGSGHLLHFESRSFFCSGVRRRWLNSSHLSMISLKSEVFSVGTSTKLDSPRIIDWKILQLIRNRVLLAIRLRRKQIVEFLFILEKNETL